MSLNNRGMGRGRVFFTSNSCYISLRLLKQRTVMLHHVVQCKVILEGKLMVTKTVTIMTIINITKMKIAIMLISITIKNAITIKKIIITTNDNTEKCKVIQ